MHPVHIHGSLHSGILQLHNDVYLSCHAVSTLPYYLSMQHLQPLQYFEHARAAQHKAQALVRGYNAVTGAHCGAVNDSSLAAHRCTHAAPSSSQTTLGR